MCISKMIDRGNALGIPIWSSEVLALLRTTGPPEQEIHSNASCKQHTENI